mgnify:CR=1 FL=1
MLFLLDSLYSIAKKPVGVNTFSRSKLRVCCTADPELFALLSGTWKNLRKGTGIFAGFEYNRGDIEDIVQI